MDTIERVMDSSCVHCSKNIEENFCSFCGQKRYKRIHRMSNEELKKRLKVANFALGLMVGALMVSLVLNIFVNKKGIWLSLVVPLSLTPITLLVYKSITEIKTELKSRNN
jgi:hypothetical protein